MAHKDGTTVGLALSGGGYRATLFTLGTLWRLNDAGWLPKIDRITSVSGGSISSAFLAHKWDNLNFNDGVADNFGSEIASPLMDFCSKSIDVQQVLKGVFNPFSKASNHVSARYDESLFDGRELASIPDPKNGKRPRFIIYATNLQTGVSFRFTPSYVADYKIGRLSKHKILLSQAVAASSAFPPVLSPFVIKSNPNDWTEGDASLPELRAMRKKVVLTDGGVYDNMGLEGIWKRYDQLLVCDAGGPLQEKGNSSSMWHSQMGRVRGIMMEQTRALRRRMLLRMLTSGEKTGAYWRIRSEIKDFDFADSMTIDTTQSKKLQFIRTRLNKFSKQEQGQLVNWGYALTDVSLRKHVDSKVPKGRWPVPEFVL